MEIILPTQSLWYIVYISNPNVDCKKFQSKFWHRFQMLYTSFLSLVADAKEGMRFPSWTEKNYLKINTPLPLELSILGLL